MTSTLSLQQMLFLINHKIVRITWRIYYCDKQHQITFKVNNSRNLTLCQKPNATFQWQPDEDAVHTHREMVQDLDLVEEGPDENAQDDDFLEDLHMAL